MIVSHLFFTNQSSWYLSIIFHLLQKHRKSEYWDDKKLNLRLCSLSFAQVFWKYLKIPQAWNMCSFSTIFFFQILSVFWSSRPEVLCRKGVLQNFAKFTGTHITQVFSCEFCKHLKNIFLTSPLTASEGLILKIIGIIQKITASYVKW